MCLKIKHSVSLNRGSMLQKPLPLAALPPQCRKKNSDVSDSWTQESDCKEPKRSLLLESTLLSNLWRHSCAASSLTLSYWAVRAACSGNVLWNMQYYAYASLACSRTAAYIKSPGEQQCDWMKWFQSYFYHFKRAEECNLQAQKLKGINSW